VTDPAIRPACVVFDIDGVLADVRHRLHHVERKPKDWDAFFAGMADDPPLPEGIELARNESAAGRDLAFLTGRSESYRQVTQDWLDRHEVPRGQLIMRPDGDYRPAKLFKPAALRRIASTRDVTYLVDDDLTVVETLRAAGWQVRHATWMTKDQAQQESLFAAQEHEGRS
jgi:phosphoglycolate phosphatase-like HAD superfamily hydrolase